MKRLGCGGLFFEDTGAIHRERDMAVSKGLTFSEFTIASIVDT